VRANTGSKVKPDTGGHDTNQPTTRNETTPNSARVQTASRTNNKKSTPHQVPDKGSVRNEEVIDKIEGKINVAWEKGSDLKLPKNNKESAKEPRID
jgi:hypothetical protein